MPVITNTPDDRFRELAHRRSDGIEVVLLWHQHTSELAVCVWDDRSGTYFELPAEPDRALDTFNHPYAHAAFRGIAYGDPACPSPTS